LEQADVTALGRLLYACLTALWPGSEPTGLPEAPLGAFGYASPRRIQPAASAALDRLADQILAATPRAGHPRLATAAQVLTALSQTLGAANPTADLAHRVLVTGPIQASRPALGAGAAIQPVIVPALGTATGSGAKAADTAASRSDAASRNQPDHTAATGRAAAASDAGRPAAEPPDSAGPHRHAATGQAGLTAAGRTAAGPLASGRATGCPTTTGRPAAEQAAAVSDSSHSNAAASTSSGAGSSKSGAARPGGGRTTAGQATAAAPAGLARFGSGGARRVGLIVLAVIVALAVVAAIIANLSRGAGDDNDDSDNSTEPSQSAAALTPVAVQTIRSFNPVGGGEENEILVGQAIDGNLATDWHTVVYGNSPDFGGLGLGGVGLVVDFGGPVAIRQAKLQLTNSPSPVMLLVPLAADLTEPPFDSITAWTPVAQDSTQPPAAYDPAGPAPSTVVIDCDTTTRFLLVYFHDKLPYLNATQYQTGISEMSFYG
jgi:hypothetical protein